jgi:hypothetical protein
MPALKPTSKVPEIVEVFVRLTTFAASNRPSWRLHDDYFSMFNPNILSEFSNKIDHRNGLPSLHLAVTCVERPCQCRNNCFMNSKIHPDLLCIYGLDGDTRVSFNAQQRKSIYHYKIRCPDF